MPDAIRGFQLGRCARSQDVIGATNRYIVKKGASPGSWRKTRRAARRARTRRIRRPTRCASWRNSCVPFVPGTAEQLLQMLGQPLHASSWATLANQQLTAGTTLGETVALFPMH